MANRAYLYCRENIDWSRQTNSYLDSRWNVPFAWFFFFSNVDMQLVPVTFQSSSWQELKIVADKTVATTAFVNRLDLLAKLLPDNNALSGGKKLIDTITKWSGQYLHLDAEEVFGGMQYETEWHKEKWSSILTQIDNKNPDIENLRTEICFYSGNQIGLEFDC